MPTPGPYSGSRDMARHFRTGSALAGPVRGTPIAQVESRRVDGAEDPQQLVRAGFDVGDRELRLVRAVAGRVRTGHCGELHHGSGGCRFEPNVRSQSITIGSGALFSRMPTARRRRWMSKDPSSFPTPPVAPSPYPCPISAMRHLRSRTTRAAREPERDLLLPNGQRDVPRSGQRSEDRDRRPAGDCSHSGCPSRGVEPLDPPASSLRADRRPPREPRWERPSLQCDGVRALHAPGGREGAPPSACRRDRARAGRHGMWLGALGRAARVDFADSRTDERRSGHAVTGAGREGGRARQHAVADQARRLPDQGKPYVRQPLRDVPARTAFRLATTEACGARSPEGPTAASAPRISRIATCAPARRGTTGGWTGSTRARSPTDGPTHSSTDPSFPTTGIGPASSCSPTTSSPRPRGPRSRTISTRSPRNPEAPTT